jgi:hypothetical protein
MFRNTLIFAATALVIPVTTMAIEMTDYVSPDSFYDEAYLTGQFRINSGNQDQTSFDGTAFRIL